MRTMTNLPPSLKMIHKWPVADQQDYLSSKRAKKVDTSDPIDWIQKEFYIPELEGPIQLYPYQIAVLREALSKDENGNFNYNLILWGDIKKSAKSCIAAAVALYTAWTKGWASIKVIANDQKQADSRVAFYVRRAVQLNPKLRELIKVINYKLNFPNYSVIEAIPIDPKGEAGGNDDLIVYSELWGAKNEAAQKMWTETTLSPTKFGKSQRWVETYAGFNGESPILERLYERGITRGERIDLSYAGNDLSDLEIYREGGMLMLWNTIPRLPFQTPEYYAAEEADLLPSEFQRVHRNQWASSQSKFVEKEWWNSCLEQLPPMTKKEMCVLAADANKGSETTTPADCFALVLVTRHPNRPKDVAIRYCGIWQAEPGKLMDYDPIKQEIRRLCQEYSVVELAYDPYQLHDMMTTFKKEGVANTKEFSQTGARLKADKLLRDLIINKRIAHDGNPLLAQHIDNANIQNHGEDGIRLVKRNQKDKIDAAVALSMAASRVLYYNI